MKLKDMQLETVYTLQEALKRVLELHTSGFTVETESCSRVGEGYYYIYYTDKKPSNFVGKAVPDFDYLKSIAEDEDAKEKLIEIASEYDIKVDSRKSYANMLKSFTGKYHSKK